MFVYCICVCAVYVYKYTPAAHPFAQKSMQNVNAMPISFRERIFGIFEFYLLDVWTADNNATRKIPPLDFMYELSSFPDEYEIYSDAKHNIKISFDSMVSVRERVRGEEFLCLRQ